MKCIIAACKCRARFGQVCGRHASKCNYKIDGKVCKKACEPGENICSNHKNDLITCYICYKDVDTKNITQFSSCSHSFCKSCVKNWIQTQENKNQYPSCPMCRTPIDIEPKSTKQLIVYISHKLKSCKYVTDRYEKLKIMDSLFIILSKPLGLSFLDKYQTFKQVVLNKIDEYKFTYSEDPIIMSYYSKWCTLYNI